MVSTLYGKNLLLTAALFEELGKNGKNGRTASSESIFIHLNTVH